MQDQWIRSGEGFLLVYSITDRASFQKIRTFHKSILRVVDKDRSPIVIVGNKCDLEFERQVGMHEGRDLAKQLNCVFIETSAKLRINVDEVFYTLVREIRRHYRERHTRRPSNQAHVPVKPDTHDHELSIGQCVPGCVGGCIIA